MVSLNEKTFVLYDVSMVREVSICFVLVDETYFWLFPQKHST